MNKKKILFLGLSAFSQAGGIEKVNKSWLRSLTIINQENPEFKIKAAILLDDKPDKKYIEKFHFKGFKGRKLLFSIYSILSGFWADTLILSHIHLAPVAWMIMLLKPKTKLILHAHGIEVWGNLNAVQQKVIQASTQILAVSHFTKQQLVNKHQVDENKIAVFPNALDPYFKIPKILDKPNYLLARYQIKPIQKVLLTLARLSFTEQYKGYDKIIQLLPELIKTNQNVVYLIAGKADEKEIIRLKQLVNQYKVNKYVKFLGFIQEDELIAHYQLADVYVMPSEGEGFGITFIEASACGVPVLAGNSDGSRDAVISGQTGLLCDPKKPKEILKTIVDLLNFNQKTIEIQNSTINNYGFKNYAQKIKILLH
ncbi:glycosyltransferase family 4 protein [Pedobacter cryophilus]|uniref:Glycosyltransferase family 4 protein n=1 Tax=Pedobacter cryophilus TaxID=2571271 RepID=A0A4U1BZI4_9SPHI|nr:glycosyltransferase family 4 protein [Pedobacter cryophilus]TKB98632.1 glycosyltransferase family 4 protein [Pedobacter cryophilus]